MPKSGHTQLRRKTERGFSVVKARSGILCYFLIDAVLLYLIPSWLVNLISYNSCFAIILYILICALLLYFISSLCGLCYYTLYLNSWLVIIFIQR